MFIQNIFIPLMFILMSGETFNGLTPEEQEIIMKISDEAVAYERERCSEYEAVALENIKSYPGMNYAELSPEVVEEMKAACAGIKDLAYEKVEHPEVIDLLYSEAEKAERKNIPQNRQQTHRHRQKLMQHLRRKDTGEGKRYEVFE